MRRFAPLVPIVIALSLPFVPTRGAYTLGFPKVEPKAEPDKVTVFRNATIYTATADKPIASGVMIVHKGKIVELGTAAEVKIPADAEVIDLKDAIIIPGLVDTHSHIGVWGRPSVTGNSDGNEMSGPVQPSVRALDSFNPDD